MHVLHPESLLFSLTKDIRIKLILYYQTLYTTEVANNTEFKERRFFFFLSFTYLSSATQESTVQNNSLNYHELLPGLLKDTRYPLNRQILISLLHVAKPLATRGRGGWSLNNLAWEATVLVALSDVGLLLEFKAAKKKLYLHPPRDPGDC